MALPKDEVFSNGTYDFERVWTYDDESKWPGHKCRVGGPRQSPIDIRAEDIVVDYNTHFIKYGQLELSGYTGVLMTGVNNGLTVQFSTDGEYSIHPVMTGGPLSRQYRLEQLHFHWVSEHAIDGHKYPMEIHFVHVRTDLTVSQALKSKDGLAIISVFCNVKAILSEEQEERISDIMELIPSLLTTGSRVSGALLNLRKLINPNSEYYTYAGSLTSPECNEAVIWIIFQTPLYISDVQYRWFLTIGVNRHNFRSLQPLRHHVVYTPAPDSIWQTPAFVTAVTDFFGDITMFFRNITRYAVNVTKIVYNKTTAMVKDNFYTCKDFVNNKELKKYGFK